MNLDEARELREELEVIEATMHRIKSLWLSRDFPSAARLEGLASAAGRVRSSLAGAKELYLSDDFPMPEDFEELHRTAEEFCADLESIKEKAEDLPRVAG